MGCLWGGKGLLKAMLLLLLPPDGGCAGVVSVYRSLEHISGALLRARFLCSCSSLLVRLEVLVLLLSSCSSSLTLVCQDGETALFNEAKKGHSPIVESLLAHNADVNLQSNVTPLISLPSTQACSLCPSPVRARLGDHGFDSGLSWAVCGVAKGY